jgi:hypothetical protein
MTYNTRKHYDYIKKWADSQPEELWKSTRVQNNPDTSDGYGYDERGFVKYSTEQVYTRFLQDMNARKDKGDEVAGELMFIGKPKFSTIMAVNGYIVQHRKRDGKSIRCYIRV